MWLEVEYGLDGCWVRREDSDFVRSVANEVVLGEAAPKTRAPMFASKTVALKPRLRAV